MSSRSCRRSCRSLAAVALASSDLPITGGDTLSTTRKKSSMRRCSSAAVSLASASDRCPGEPTSSARMDGGTHLSASCASARSSVRGPWSSSLRCNRRALARPFRPPPPAPERLLDTPPELAIVRPATLWPREGGPRPSTLSSASPTAPSIPSSPASPSARAGPSTAAARSRLALLHASPCTACAALAMSSVANSVIRSSASKDGTVRSASALRKSDGYRKSPSDECLKNTARARW
mmetsp:Transcript_18941/g.72297  ORF Transcript_18941/g.72297 Transcript_18941/m.72297 type:complete len:236 (-) Transcript_18941:871-1578(-)